MARALTVSRATVPVGAETEYLRLLGRLARLGEERGRHLWVFRARDRAGSFLEFSESGALEMHRAMGAPAEDEARLESRLRELAAYEPGAWDLWEEVTL